MRSTLVGAGAGLPMGLGGRWAWSLWALSAGKGACFPSGDRPRARRSQRTRQARGGARGSRALMETPSPLLSRALRVGCVPEHMQGTKAPALRRLGQHHLLLKGLACLHGHRVRGDGESLTAQDGQWGGEQGKARQTESSRSLTASAFRGSYAHTRVFGMKGETCCCLVTQSCPSLCDPCGL